VPPGDPAQGGPPVLDLVEPEVVIRVDGRLADEHDVDVRIGFVVAASEGPECDHAHRGGVDLTGGSRPALQSIMNSCFLHDAET
jgi:hypothetical protein